MSVSEIDLQPKQTGAHKMPEITTLIVDDSAILRERLIELLSENLKIRVVGQALDVAGAIESFHVLKPDVVILDISMPGGSGIDVLMHIKKVSPETIVIVFTNFPYPNYRKKCMEEGADYFLEKSTEFEKLEDILRQLSEGETKGD